MKIGNPHRPVTSAWLTKEGHRLDAPPFLSGAVEARVLLDKLTVPTQPLREVTAGYNGGIYNGPQFKRNYVTSRAHGIPFLTGSSILLSDISRLPMISRKDALSKKLSYLRVEEGMTLISCSGSIGKMVYARPEMNGVWASQDVMKVVPDPEIIPPGYLYAYLSSRFGKTLITSGTYGAIIQHIEPEHISELGVPRFGIQFEKQIHLLIQKAAELRSEASYRIQKCRAKIDKRFESKDIFDNQSVNTVNSKDLKRFDAFYYNSRVQYDIKELSLVPTVKLSSVSSIFTPGIFKRMYVEDAEYGYRYFSGTEIFQVKPQERGYLSRNSKNIDNYLVRNGWILMQDAGQIGGLIGQISYCFPYMDGSALSNHIMRIIPNNSSDSAYLFAFLSSQVGQRQIVRTAFGSSIPQIDPKYIAEIDIFWPSEQERVDLSDGISQAWSDISLAHDKEETAIQLVERAIEQNYVPPEL
ncbi:methylation-associated defense system restriction endonuclease subunit S MAD5 [Deinococcus kurensis]|uniref:methylation-associated defense system restriction endonuclease subunit S MAD5 n=1 Tax=Deinococcus kurensis TaxID=2662757 RepID=UPI0012D2F00E|nr:restriction endonuclease subunit S [Deinococcus kurensis]